MNIFQLNFPSYYAFPDKVIMDLDMLRAGLKHKILRNLEGSLVVTIECDLVML